MATTAIATIFVLGILIFVHELGHFLIAKKVGVRVEQFSLGYPPKLVSKKFGDTEYSICWIPLGGYVRLAGEEPDEFRLRRAPWEFQSKPIWQRFLIVVAGPGMNFLLAIFIFWLMIFSIGTPVVKTTKVGTVIPGSPAQKAGLLAGDRILSVEGQPVREWDNIFEQIFKAESGVAFLEVERRGELLSIHLQRPKTKGQSLGILPFVGTEIGSVVRGSPAFKAGIRPGDRIIAVDGKPVEQWNQLVKAIHAKPGMSVRLVWLRDGERFEAQMVTMVKHRLDEKGRFREVGMIGIGPLTHWKKVGPFQSLWIGLSHTYRMTELIVTFVGKLILGKTSAKLLGGPILIAQMAGEVVRLGLGKLMTLMALLSINLALLNMLPIPVLDGGHLLFLAVEGMTKRPLSLKQREMLHRIGLAFLILLMIYVTYNDLARIF